MRIPEPRERVPRFEVVTVSPQTQAKRGAAVEGRFATDGRNESSEAVGNGGLVRRLGRAFDRSRRDEGSDSDTSCGLSPWIGLVAVGVITVLIVTSSVGLYFAKII